MREKGAVKGGKKKGREEKFREVKLGRNVVGSKGMT